MPRMSAGGQVQRSRLDTVRPASTAAPVDRSLVDIPNTTVVSVRSEARARDPAAAKGQCPEGRQRHAPAGASRSTTAAIAAATAAKSPGDPRHREPASAAAVALIAVGGGLRPLPRARCAHRRCRGSGGPGPWRGNGAARAAATGSRSAGSASQFGSSLRTAAMVSDRVSPRKALAPESIS